MSFRIIDNKKVNMTDDEWNMYNEICQAYQEHGGEILFADLFETNDEGNITFLRPPSKRYISFEIYFFLIALMNQQHLRVMYSRVDDIIDQFKKKMETL
jgi:hypothetical protein